MSAEPVSATPGPLSGFRIGVTSDRRAGDLVSAFQRRGAEVLHAPALRIAPHEQDETLMDETRALVAARPEIVLVTTGYGVRRWLEVADTAGVATELLAVLDDAHVMARGPKAFGAVRAAGLEHVRTTVHESTAGMVDELEASGVAYRSLGIQLHGYTDEVQLARLRRLAARVVTVTPYRWAGPESDERLDRLVEAVCARRLDVVTFTSAPGAAAVLEAADRLGRHDALVSALRRDVLAAAVGPVTAAPLVELGIEAIVPERYRMGALIRLVCDRLAQERVVRLHTGAGVLELRGGAVTVGGRDVVLGPTAMAVLRRLASCDGVVSRAELLAALPAGVDEHAVEAAVSRLRRSLGEPGVIATVVKRGYRLDATRLPAEGDVG